MGIRISGLEYRSSEIVQSKKQKGKKMFKNERNLSDLCDTIQSIITHRKGVSEGEDSENEEERKIEGTWPKLPKFYEKY